MWKRIFGEHGAKDVITLFHKPSVPASTRVHTWLKQINATSAATATQDQASSHDTQSKAEKTDFTLDVTESPPTSDQLKNILEYIGGQNAGQVVQGARDEADAMRKLKENAENFQRPVTVNWTAGKAVIGDNQSEILNLLKSKSS